MSKGEPSSVSRPLAAAAAAAAFALTSQWNSLGAPTERAALKLKATRQNFRRELRTSLLFD